MLLNVYSRRLNDKENKKFVSNRYLGHLLKSTVDSMKRGPMFSQAIDSNDLVPTRGKVNNSVNQLRENVDIDFCLAWMLVFRPGVGLWCRCPPHNVYHTHIQRQSRKMR